LRLRVRRKPDQECWYLIGAEDSSAAQAEDAKFDSARERSSTQPWMRKRGNPGKQIRVSRGTEIRGNSSRSESANGERQRFRATWKLVDRGRQGRGAGVTRRVNQGEPDGERSEVTRTSHQPVPEDKCSGRPGYCRRRYRKCEGKGQPGTFTPGTAERCEDRGDSTIHRR